MIVDHRNCDRFPTFTLRIHLPQGTSVLKKIEKESAKLKYLYNHHR